MSYAQDTFPTEYTPTVFDNYNCTMVLNDKINVSLGLWDTAGQDDFEQMRPLAYPGTHVFLICFSLASSISLSNVRHKWIKEVRSFSTDVPVVLCGTKLDLFEDEAFKKQLEDKGVDSCVDEEEVKKVAAEIGASACIKCSGKTQKNMSEVFRQCAIAGLVFQGVLKSPDNNNNNSGNNGKPNERGGTNGAGNNNGGCCIIC